MEQSNNENTIIEKKVFILSTFLLALTIIMSVSICYFLLNNKIIEATSHNIDTDTPAINTNDISQTAIEYELKEYNGKIGVYKNGALVYTLNTYVFTLPEADKQLLKDGIKASSYEELKKIIEEYY